MSANASAPVSLRRLRWAARAPRLLVAFVVLLLAAGGLRAAVAPPQAKIAPAPVPAPPDIAAQGFAAEFVRAYLTFDPDAPEARDRALEPFVADSDLGANAGVSIPAVGDAVAQRVSDARPVQFQPTDDGRASIVTVEARFDAQDAPLFVAVTVARNRAGELQVLDYPALVGGPLTSSTVNRPERPDVDNALVAGLVRRAIANYLAGDLTNLRADLSSDATVTLPAQRLAVGEVSSVRWASPRRDAVQVDLVARDAAGGEWTYSYEVGVRQEASGWRVAWIDSLADRT